MEASEKPPIGVIGVGWVGLVTGACFAEIGHPVVAVDIDAGKIEALRSGAPLPIHEPGLPELVERNRERLTFTTEMDEVLAASRLLFCCVDTPPTYSGDADLSRVDAVVAALPDGADHALVMKSTVPAGTGETIRRSHPDLVYVSCPEFLKEGSAVSDFLEPDRVVVGADPGSEWAADAVAAAYEPLGGELVRTDLASAEMIKLASNAFLATKISFINEIANVCEGVGADVNEVARGMGLDGRIGPHFLQAGIGYGGSCFPKDVSALKMLAGNTGYHFQLLNSVIEVNELQKRRVISKLTKHLGSLVGKRVALLGLAFKPNTDDMREASSLVLSARLQGEGATVVAYDPVAEGPAGAMLPSVELSVSAAGALTGADAAILVTEWPEFAELDWEELAGLMSNPLIVDGRNFLDPERLRGAGFSYEGIGRG
ncbi:MAG TPA: UDP-glucose/GDP-mannose dehydrogenase family protein [Solirubrobacterales bacterium]|nr:UDP-glucose/GDP-mannose dehydrogenase family protein [Solirubrobacterales bacterium]